jgi:RNA polymerase sigma-70 factor (ECF subfamily)
LESSPAPLNDAELIAQALAGDSRAERGLYDRHVDRVYRIAYRVAGDETLAMDITQDAFIRAFTHLRDFRGASSLSTWLCSIATSVALNTLRGRNRRGRWEAPFEDALVVGVTTRESEPDLKVRMRSAIDALPEIYRAVFVMHDVEGFTHEEIGEGLGVPSGTSKARLSRARALLRTTLADFAPEAA